ncbi:MAG: carboxypeptidase regulatory-like domain-containing protein, partial [Gammaproteobacteria bacterium]
MRRIVVLAALFVFPALAGAQSFTASIRGTVTDPSQAGVPGARVVATQVDRNAEHVATTDSVGRYVLTALPPGRYSLTAEATGFKRYSQPAFELRVDQQVQVDIMLSVGSVTETVEVVAEAPLLESVTSSVGKVVDNRRIVSLPLNTRNVYALVFLTPGVSGSVGYNYGEMRYAVNGARERMLDTLIDGAPASHPTVNGGGGISVFPSVDAIEEFKVMGANYQAEFGRSQGSILNVIFKSGSNAFHGSAFEFLRNSVLDSNNFFANRGSLKLGSFKRNQFGGMLSGPIRQNKTFFMADYEGLRERSARNTNPPYTVPTELQRRGDFSQTFTTVTRPTGERVIELVRVFNPFTTRAAGTGFTRDPFENNIVPANLLDPVALNVIKYYPQGNVPGLPVTNQQNYQKSGTQQINIDQFDVRIDHNLSDTRKIYGRYSHRHTGDVPPIYFPQEQTIAEGRIKQEDRVRGGVLDYT